MPFKLSSFYRICKLIRLRSDILKNEAPMYKFKHKNRGDELTSSVFIVMHIKIGTIFKTPILRVPFTQVHPHISVWGVDRFLNNTHVDIRLKYRNLIQSRHKRYFPLHVFIYAHVYFLFSDLANGKLFRTVICHSQNLRFDAVFA